MLDEYRQIHEKIATEFLGDSWRIENKNTLINKCLEYEKSNQKLYNAYLSAVIARYFNLVPLYTSKCSGAYSAEDCYEWLLDVIMMSLKDRPWLSGSGNRLEGDKNGPDKYINVCMKSRVQGFYQWSNAAKRAKSFTCQTSLENMVEATGDTNMPGEDKEEDIDSSLVVKEIVKKRFSENEFAEAFIIDGIINSPCIDFEQDKDTKWTYSYFNKKKLQKHIRSIDDSYCRTFSKMYKIPLNEVINAKDICVKLSTTKIYTKLNKTLLKLAKMKLGEN